MNEVTYPLRRRMRRAQVGDLQVVLKELLAAYLLSAQDEERRRELGAALEAERSKSVFGPTTHRLVTLLQEERQEEHGLAVSGEVDERTALVLNELVAGLRRGVDDARDGLRYEVSGVVRFDSGLPAGGVLVEAVDRDLRAEQPLGSTETTADGAYWLEYFERDVRNRERGTADLLVRACTSYGSRLVESSVLFSAPRQAQIDLTIPRDRLSAPSLLSRVRAAIDPLLGDLPVDELDEGDRHDDLTFLAGEAGLEKRVIGRFVLAHQLARAGISLEFWFALLGNPSFEYTDEMSLAENLRRIWTRLPTLGEVALGRTLEAAFQAGDVEEAFRKEMSAWSEEFARLLARGVLEDQVGASFVRAALEEAGVDDSPTQEKFSRLLRSYGSFNLEFLAALEDDPSFAEGTVAELSTSFQLGELTGSDFAVVRMLTHEFDIRDPGRISALARVGSSDWSDLIARKLKDGTIEVPLDFGELAEPLESVKGEIYANMLERRLREAFPTQAFAGELERAGQNGGARGLKHPHDLGRLLSEHGEFELLTTPIDQFLDDGVGRELRRLADDESFRRELKAVQRIFKLAPTFQATDALLAEGLHSAQRVYRVGESRFARRFSELTGSSEDEGRVIWMRAADTYSAVLTILGDLSGLRSESQPRALQMNTGALTMFPNWDSLFQGGDLCSCDHCRSVLGPAAYFADLLMFLADRTTADGSSVKDLLLSRRPDLGRRSGRAGRRGGVGEPGPGPPGRPHAVAGAVGQHGIGRAHRGGRRPVPVETPPTSGSTPGA